MKIIENKKKLDIFQTIGMIVLVLSLFGSIAEAIPIDKKDTLGPYDGGHKYYIVKESINIIS